MTQTITILNSRPGMLRGGIAHPARATYDLAAFTPAQLALILAEPAFATFVCEGPQVIEIVPPDPASVHPASVHPASVHPASVPVVGDPAPDLAPELGARALAASDPSVVVEPRRSPRRGG